MPGLLGFNPTRPMLEAYKLTKKEEQVVRSEQTIETKVVEVEIKETVPVKIQEDTEPVKLTEIPSEVKDCNTVVEEQSKEIVSVEIPAYTHPVKLPELPSEVNDYSNIKRSVNLNPLSDE